MSPMNRQGHLTDWGDGIRSLNYLMTGPSHNRLEFAWNVWPDIIEARDRTQRFRLFLLPGETPEEAEAKLIAAATKADVTLQRLVDVGPSEEPGETHDLGDGASATVSYRQEEYPVVHLGSHGQQWP